MKNVLILPPRSAAEAAKLAREARQFGLDAVAQDFEAEARCLALEELERNILALLYPAPISNSVH